MACPIETLEARAVRKSVICDYGCGPKRFLGSKTRDIEVEKFKLWRAEMKDVKDVKDVKVEVH